jgi:MFS transporter, DHA1 family, multidrug resistance protein
LVLWISQFIALIGMSGVIPFLPLYVRELGVSDAQAPLWSGIIIAAPFAMASMLTPLWGAMGDRYGQKLMVVRALAGLGISVGLMGFATNIWVLLFLRLLQGAVSGFVASNNAFVSAQTPPERAGYALGTLQTSISAGFIVGPLIGGAISDAFGFRTVFFFVALLCAMSLVIVSMNVKEEAKRAGGRSARVWKNLTLVKNDVVLRRLMLILFLGQTAVVLTGPIFPYYLQELGAPLSALSSLAGLATSLVGIGILVSSPWWGSRSDRIGYRRSMTLASLLVVAGMLSQIAVPSYEWIFPLRALIGLAVGALLPLTYSELTRRAPAGRRGGIMGLASSATLMGNLVGPLLCALIASNLPLRWTFVAAAVLMIIVHGLARTFPTPRTEPL